jgi:hypothetical protein
MTEGYSNYGMKFTPYGTTLKKYLEENLSVERLSEDVNVRIEGKSGELVVCGFKERMEGICKFFFFTCMLCGLVVEVKRGGSTVVKLS